MTQSTYKSISISAPEEGIEVVSLNRPDALNTITPGMVDDLCDYFAALHGRHDIRVVLLRGEGRAFCAGLDLTGWDLFKKVPGRMQRRMASQKRIVEIVHLMRSCPQPIIGLGHGAACGGGFAMLLASDVRYVAPNVRMNAASMKIGLGGCDIGSSYFLPRLVGASVAAEYLLTGRFITADRAAAMMLVSEVVAEEALLTTGLALAREMMLASPLGLRLTKEALNLNIDAPSLEAATAIEDRQQVIMLGTDDFAEAVSAFMEKRPPNYKDQ